MFFLWGGGRNQNVSVAMIIVYGNEKQTEFKWPLTTMSDTFKSMKMYVKPEWVTDFSSRVKV